MERDFLKNAAETKENVYSIVFFRIFAQRIDFIFFIMSTKPSSYKDILYKSIVYIAAVVLIVSFMPSDGKFNYQFDKGKPWRYGQLVATFDFPIYKDENTVKQEEDSVLKLFQPYYDLDPEVYNQQLMKLQTNDGHLLHVPNAYYLKHIEQTLATVYQRGIISNADADSIARWGVSGIQVVERNMASTRKANEVFTVKEAYEYLIHADTLRYNKHVLQQCDLNNYIMPNLTYDATKSGTSRKELLESISAAKGMVLSEEKIVDRGEIVTDDIYSKLLSYEKESLKRSDSNSQQRLIWLGQFLFVGIFMGAFFIYLELFRRDYFERKRSLLLLISLMTVFPVITSLMVTYEFLSVYMLPIAMLPIAIRVFMDSRTAFMAHMATILICSVVLRYPYDFLILQVVGGLAAIHSLRDLSQRSQLFRTAFFITLCYCLTYFAYELITENDLSKLNLPMYFNFLINGVLLLFAYPFLFVLEKLFGFTSNVTLVELSNINHPLLRQLSEVAPGTFQHTMQVANLAAEAANKIEAKSQLVRTGALYHDIGKMSNPVFFTENQSGVNPHKNLPYEQSAQIIINHVTYGLKLAEKYNLPKVIRDFIATHHGHGKTKYFYISYKNEHPDEPVDENIFTYPGPNPQTREQAILMMADAVEAASHSLKEYTEESINGLVDKIIDSQVADGFFLECPITFKDISTIKALFKEKLKAVYHTRISYPELKK